MLYQSIILEDRQHKTVVAVGTFNEIIQLAKLTTHPDLTTYNTFNSQIMLLRARRMS